MGRRRDERVQVKLPVRVFGTDADGAAFTRLAHTADVSRTGTRISGIYVRLCPGDIVGVQHGTDKCRFRVVWVAKQGSSNAGEVGLCSLEPNRQIWGVDLTAGWRDEYSLPAGSPERRLHTRYACDIGVKVRVLPETNATYARCTDISLGGCYLETWSTMPPGTRVDLLIALPSGPLAASAVVRTVHPAFGMGMQLATVQDRHALKSFIDQLAKPSSSRDAVDETAGTSVTRAPAAGQQPHANAGANFGFTRPARILVAEDSNFLKNAYAYCLRREGYEVILARDGEEALALAASHQPDVIVLDLLMPKMGGVDALKLLKSDSLTRDIRVIVVSGLSQNNEGKLISEGALTYLEKSDVGPEQLVRYVRQALETKSTQGDSSSIHDVRLMS
jgi:CheY-like chemotaxis protein